MAFGPGKYDELCTFVRAESDARLVVVVVVGGNKGDGFDVQERYTAGGGLPFVHLSLHLLRKMAGRDEPFGRFLLRALGGLSSIRITLGFSLTYSHLRANISRQVLPSLVGLPFWPLKGGQTSDCACKSFRMSSYVKFAY